MNLVQRVRSARHAERASLEDYASWVAQAYYSGGLGSLNQSYKLTDGRTTERSDSPFESLVATAYKRNGVVFACQLARLLLFSEARFQFQQLRGGRPGDLYGTPELGILENPWPNGSTGELLARMIQDVDLAGNAYVRRTGPLAERRLERLRPDWVSIVMGSNSDLLNAEVVGYFYEPNGPGRGDPIYLTREEMAHWSPIPDPVAHYRGMTWMTTVLREIQADGAALDHKSNYFNKAATPNMVIKFDQAKSLESVKQFKELFESAHAGAGNAWKNLYLGAGADVSVVGNNFKDMDYKAIMAAGETRIAAAAGVPPVIAGLSEGLAAATYSNYQQSRRRFADITIRPLWRSCCAALASILTVPSNSRLWYDDRDVPALQEDEKDAADIESVKATTITNLVREGFEPGSVVKAVMAQDMSLLVHTGALSVQLVQPGEGSNTNGSVPQGVSA